MKGLSYNSRIQIVLRQMEASESITFRNRDPLSNFVLDRLSWSPQQYGGFILIVNLIIDCSEAIYFKAFVTQSGPPGLLQDPTTLVVNYVMMPVIGGFYIWSIGQIESLLNQLRTSHILAENSVIDNLAQKLQQSLRSKWALVVAIIISLIVALLLVGTYLNWYPWPQGIGFIARSEILPWLKAPMWFVTMYGICFGLFNINSTILALREIFRDQRINISPWHPDRCGGLKGISQYSATLGYAIAVVGLTVSVQTIQEIAYGTFASSYLTWIGLVAYVLCAPLIFFLPLGTAHTAMRKAQQSHLLVLSKQFDEQYNLITDTIEDSPDELEASVMKIECLQTLYKITEDFTIWPFDIVNLRRFLTITLAPLLPGVVTAAFELANRFLLK